MSSFEIADQSEEELKLNAYKEFMDYVVRNIQKNIAEGRDLQDDYSKNKLFMNTIEAEGYIRACLTIRNELIDCSDLFKELYEKESDV